MRGVVWQAASVESFYSYSLFPAVSNQSPCLFSKSSKLHTQLREHGRMDFAGKEADMVLERRGQIFFCVCGSKEG